MPRQRATSRDRRVAWTVVLLVLLAALLSTLAPPLLPPLALPAHGAAAAGRPNSHEASDEVRFRRARSFALRQLAGTSGRLSFGRYPVLALGRAPWRTEDASSWMAGFFPGQLWLAYEASGAPVWAHRARLRQGAIRSRQRDTSTHDLGFVMLDSFGQGLRLTGEAAPRPVLLNAAASLASRYVPAARTLRSWDGPAGQVTLIVDNMVNLELLFWGARHGGDPAWRDIALQHALTTRENIVRGDGSTFHAARFDESTGARVWRGTVGGWRDWSTWARGQAWAVYGFTTAYRETADRRMLDVARSTARFALRHLPADGVPFWDYGVPVTRGTLRDSSAGAVLASALLDLARLDPDPGRRARYRAAGLHTLRSLAGPRYLARGTGSRSVLLHGRHSPRHPDAGVPYGDYYFLEALQRVQLLPSHRPALRVAHVSANRAMPGHPAGAVLDGRRATRWSAGGSPGHRPALTMRLARPGRVSAVSVGWWRGQSAATRLRIRTSRDGRSWSTARTAVSSSRTAALETYDIADRSVRFVRLVGLGGSRGDRVAVSSVRVRG